MNYKSFLQKTGLSALSVLIALLLAEGLLRIVYPAQLQYYVWPPKLYHHFTPDTSILSGISPHSIFSINQYGVRTGGGNIDRELNIITPPTGTIPAKKKRYCLCIGGSTTECLYLDDNKTWEAQIAWQAKDAADSSLAFIGNIGKSGCTSTDNYIHLKYCAAQYKKINTVVFMVGINDMLKRLSRDTLFQNNFMFTPQVEDSLVNIIFGSNTGTRFYKNTVLYHLFRNIYHGIDKKTQDDTAQVYANWRLRRQHASAYIDTLPDMEPALAIFESNINLMIDEANRQNKQIVFVNQAALWKDSMTANEQSKLWMGGIGDFQAEGNKARHNYYTPRALRRCLTLYNQRLTKVCNQRKVKLIDIDAQLPQTLGIFYDDCHFNEAGAKLVGKIIYNGLRATPLH